MAKRIAKRKLTSADKKWIEEARAKWFAAQKKGRDDYLEVHSIDLECHCDIPNMPGWHKEDCTWNNYFKHNRDSGW